MDQAERDHIQHELEDEANKLFPGVAPIRTRKQGKEPVGSPRPEGPEPPAIGRLRRVELLQHGDAPMIEPGQVMPRLVFADPAGALGERPDPRKVAKARRTFKLAVGPGLNQFRDDLLRRWPGIRYVELVFEDDSGRRVDGQVQFLDDHRTVAADDEFTHVMVRLKAAELDIVDTLIAAGIANNRAEAIRWALTRIPERPAYEQLRQHTRDIERLKSEF